MEVSGEIRTFAAGMLKCGHENMKPEEYIENLYQAQRILGIVKADFDRAICRMHSRIETGNKDCERDSRLAALAGCEFLKLAENRVFETATSGIDY